MLLNYYARVVVVATPGGEPEPEIPRYRPPRRRGRLGVPGVRRMTR